MNKLGIWQLVLMAQEGDRKAIDELFFITHRAAFLVAYSITKDKQAALDILADGYCSTFATLNELDEAINFAEALNSQNIKRLSELMTSGKLASFPADAAERCKEWVPENIHIVDFNTISHEDMAMTADEIIALFNRLPMAQKLCIFLYFYVEMSPLSIASVLGTSTEAVCGTLAGVLDNVLPQLAKIQYNTPALQNVPPESLIIWALKNTFKNALTENELRDFYSVVLGRLVSEGVLDTARVDREPDEYTELDLKDMSSPSRLRRVFRPGMFFKVFIVIMVILVLGGMGYGFNRISKYRARMNEMMTPSLHSSFTYTLNNVVTEREVFSTEYDEVSSGSASSSEGTATTAPATETTTEQSVLSGLAYKQSGGSIIITGYNGSVTDVEIPATISNRPVTELAPNAFLNSDITSIKLPSSVITIGAGAFCNCVSLKSVVLPTGISRIPDKTFRGCSGLSTIIFPSSLKNIGAEAFYGCSSLVGAALPSSTVTIGAWAFAYCSRLATVSVPQSVSSIGDNLFYECTALTNCNIAAGSTLTYLGESMFYNCTSLQSLAIPSGVTTIPSNCFFGCTSLATVTLPYALANIEESAFSGCSRLTNISFSNNFRRLGSTAFSGCTSLTGVTFSTGTISIGASAFSGCSSLNNVIIPASVTEIGTNAFSGCSTEFAISCPEESYAATYAQDNSIPIKSN